ncbi:OX26 protein, partial [Campylorhamphus procurvoides]|nr:OX26 protein [Campylorhamphus procurvoides]
MRAPFSLSCLFLLSLGACIPPSERREPAHRGEGTLPGPGGRAAAAEPGWRRREELEALLGIIIPRELRGHGSEGTGQRPGRRGVMPTQGEKRSGTLGNLAEELSGYNRRKGGFTFRFGR